MARKYYCYLISSLNLEYLDFELFLLVGVFSYLKVAFVRQLGRWRMFEGIQRGVD